jgi:hypothetical protein
MDVADLRLALEDHGVRETAYDLDLAGFTLPNDRYCLRSEGRLRWIAFYNERGQRFDERTWITESEACEHFVHALVNDRGAMEDT